MLKIRYKFLFAIGLLLFLGSSAAVVTNAQNRRPKNTGTLTVKTSPVAYPVRVNGEMIGMSGVDDPAEFYLLPGTHKMEVEFPNGKMFVRDIEIRKDAKNCVCLRYVENTITRPCPYDVRIDGPDNVIEGDLITFAAFNAVTSSTTPINYRWIVSPESARITSGLGTSAITIDTTGIGNQTVSATLDVTDDVYGAKCFQNIAINTRVERQKTPEPRRFDEFESQAFDDDKARLDSFVIELQNNPDSQGYIILYQGTDSTSMRSRRVEVLNKRTLDYLVNTRGIDPRRLWIVEGGTRLKTTYELWIVPPGAQPPVPAP
ncbi:hypothetical protein BH20ACI4_BH20ACI4_29950 [soil metagenome]